MVPAGQPPHRRQPLANGEQRLRMLELSLAGVPGLQLDDGELRRDGPSYMVDTLQALRVQHPQTPLVLILGMDAFLGLPQWHQWHRLLELAHLAVMARPGAWPQLPSELSSLMQQQGVDSSVDAATRLAARPAGCVVRLQLSQLDISASAIRELLGQGGDPRFLVTDAVRDYLLAEKLYGAGEHTEGTAEAADAPCVPLLTGTGLQRLDHLVLTVADIPATVAFYSEVLGMRPLTFADDRVALCFGPHKINLHQLGRELQPRAERATPGAADLCLVSAMDMPRLQQHLQRAGVTIELGPVARSGALGPMHSLYFRDPDRNLIELANYHS